PVLDVMPARQSAHSPATPRPPRVGDESRADSARRIPSEANRVVAQHAAERRRLGHRLTERTQPRTDCSHGSHFHKKAYVAGRRASGVGTRPDFADPAADHAPTGTAKPRCGSSPMG